MAWKTIASLLALACSALAGCSTNSSCPATTLHIKDGPYQNYFYSDCNVDAQTVITSPLQDSNLTIIGPRLIVAWPAGNSGICTFFQPQSGKNGSLAIELVNSTLGSPMGPVYEKKKNGSSSSAEENPPVVGVEGILSFNSSAELSLAILGSVRTIRDFTEGPSLLQPMIQDAINVTRYNGTGVEVSRLWLDNVTTSTFTLVPWQNDDVRVHITNSSTVKFGAGFYRFSASFNYPQLTQLKPQAIVNNESQALLTEQPDTVKALSFFSYTEKLLAGGWRFLTYFGRDSLISALLLQPVLSTGDGSAMEAVLGAALERINRTDGTVAHEETIGDYATYLNLQKNISSSAAGFQYPMIDTDYFLPILMDRYFAEQPSRIKPLLETQAGEVDVENKNLTWGDLGYTLAQKIMNITEAFESEQTAENLIHLKEGEQVGQWRDSNRGLGNGRIPFDVNCALVPAGLWAISRLAASPGVFPNNSVTADWADKAAKRAKIWEDETLAFFEHSTTVEDASSLLDDYSSANTYYNGPTHAESLGNFSSNGSVVDYALSLESAESPKLIRVTHTDTAFRNALLNTTNDEQLTKFLNASANAILRPFPAGLTTSVGVVVANPALSGSEQLVANLTNSAYHGTVVWGWQLALLARGFELQLARCEGDGFTSPAFCNDKPVYGAVRDAYNTLWDVLDDNKDLLQSEVWSWVFTGNGTEGEFEQVPLGALPPPPGEAGGTESNVRQLWSLCFLAVTRNEDYK